MIKRETYMSRIRPFIGNDLIKVMTGIRRSGKSVMLELVKEELTESGIPAGMPDSVNSSFTSSSMTDFPLRLMPVITLIRSFPINGRIRLI